METHRFHARAKVNLALSVGPPEPADSERPGWHRICSWMHCIELADEIKIGPAREGEPGVVVEWDDGSPVDWPLESDLATKARVAVEQRAGEQAPVQIRVRKSIPSGGGLGGGSADAAVVMMAVNRAMGMPFTIDDLRRVSATLGSDVAFFLDEFEAVPRPAIVRGFGESIERLDRLCDELLLIVPPFGCSTPEVYRASDAAPSGLDEARVRALAAGPLDSSLLFNDLASAAERVEPRVRAIRRQIQDATGKHVHLSGSGSTMFVVAPHADAACVASAAPNCRIIPTRLV